MRRLIVLFFVLAYSTALFAKSGKEHVDDMHSVFGKSERRDEVNQMFEAITRLADERDPTLTLRLKEIVPNYSQGNYTHRIYFHWGFNGNPKDSLALKERLDVAECEAGLREEFYDAIKAVQKSRNSKVMLYVQICCTDPVNKSRSLSRREMNAVAALAYDTHIVGDYITGTEKSFKALMPMNKLSQDILRVLDVLVKEDSEFRNNPERKLLQKQLKHRFNEATNASSSDEVAEKMLRAMTEICPKLLLMTGRVRNAMKLVPAEEDKGSEPASE